MFGILWSELHYQNTNAAWTVNSRHGLSALHMRTAHSPQPGSAAVRGGIGYIGFVVLWLCGLNLPAMKQTGVNTLKTATAVFVFTINVIIRDYFYSQMQVKCSQCGTLITRLCGWWNRQHLTCQCQNLPAFGRRGVLILDHVCDICGLLITLFPTIGSWLPWDCNIVTCCCE
jgi:hypothetical protein